MEWAKYKSNADYYYYDLKVKGEKGDMGEPGPSGKGGSNGPQGQPGMSPKNTGISYFKISCNQVDF